MKRLILVAFALAISLTACLVVPEGRHYGPGAPAVVIAPPLPSVVILGDDPYYYNGGYYYYYQGNSWSYSRSRGGPWVTLPRDRYPGEVRYKHRDEDNDRGHGYGHEKEHGRGHDDD